MAKCVLDASALLALLNDEPGSEVVLKNLAHAVISSVNFTEVLSKLLDQNMPYAIAKELLGNLNLDIIDFDYEQSLGSALLRTKSKAHGLSLADRVCLNLAQKLALPALTADKAWGKLNAPHLKVVVIH